MVEANKLSHTLREPDFVVQEQLPLNHGYRCILTSRSNSDGDSQAGVPLKGSS